MGDEDDQKSDDPRKGLPVKNETKVFKKSGDREIATRDKDLKDAGDKKRD